MTDVRVVLTTPNGTYEVELELEDVRLIDGTLINGGPGDMGHLIDRAAAAVKRAVGAE